MGGLHMPRSCIAGIQAKHCHLVRTGKRISKRAETELVGGTEHI